MKIQDLSNSHMLRELDDTQAKKVKGGEGKPAFPGWDAEFGYKLIWGKCGAHEVIGPDGKCINPELPNISRHPVRKISKKALLT
ncbi:MAG: hypothetical protein Tsb0014_10200 [Pleurocapsa sp.]